MPAQVKHPGCHCAIRASFISMPSKLAEIVTRLNRLRPLLPEFRAAIRQAFGVPITDMFPPQKA
jgi:hypothetical protein